MAISRTDVIVALPRPLTSLIGREKELNHLYDLLRSDVALVTITGFGGIGKTRLSLQAALELEPHFEAGAIFVTLSSVTQGNLIPRAIAITAGLDESIDSAEALADALGPPSRLLVLDNLEQIPDAAGMVLQLLQAMPNATILATSRSRMEISGEYVVPLEPLKTQSDSPLSLPAVQLFIERAKAAEPTLSTDEESVTIIAEICQKLDGIPLAIELAAARLSIFSLANLRDQLEHILPVLASNRVDMPDRQRTMRNAIAWTYELLDQEQRRLFNWLSVYEQDFSFESISWVAQQLKLDDEPIDLVQFLVNRSLIRPVRRESEFPRYHMLQMLREFGHEQLLATNENHLARHSHAMDMVALAEQAEPHLRTAEADKWCAILQRDIANFREAMRWSLETNADNVVLRIIGSTYRFITPYGYEAEFLGYVHNTENVDIEDGQLVRALIGIGNLQNRLLQQEAAKASFTRALDLATRIDEPLQLAQALQGLGYVAGDNYDAQAAEKYYLEADEIGKAIGDIRSQYVSAGMRGALKLETGNSEEGLQLMMRALNLAHQQGDSVGEGTMAANVAVALQYLNQFPESNFQFQRALEIAEQLGHTKTKAHVLTSMGLNYCLTGEHDKAREYANEGIALSQKHGMTQFVINGLNTLVAVNVAEGDFGTAGRHILRSLDLMLDHSAVKQYTDSASLLAEMLLSLDRRVLAAKLVAAARSLMDQHGIAAMFWRNEPEVRMQTDLESDTNPQVAEALQEGSELTVQELETLIRSVCQDLIVRCPPRSPAPEIAEQKPDIQLTPREIEVLAMLVKGLSNAQIAEEMFVSTRTVTTHLTNIFSKLEVNNRSHAVSLAIQNGLI